MKLIIKVEFINNSAIIKHKWSNKEWAKFTALAIKRGYKLVKQNKVLLSHRNIYQPYYVLNSIRVVDSVVEIDGFATDYIGRNFVFFVGAVLAKEGKQEIKSLPRDILRLYIREVNKFLKWIKEVDT